MNARKERKTKRSGGGIATKIPDKVAWAGYEKDFEVRHLHRIFYGKSIEEVQSYFKGGRSIERADELLFSPRQVFQFYVQAFALFLQSEQAIGDSDSASSFLSLLEARKKRDPGSVKSIFHLLKDSINFVAANQARFDAPVEIYGDFEEKTRRICKLCEA
jgi:hypothetical protein